MVRFRAAAGGSRRFAVRACAAAAGRLRAAAGAREGAMADLDRSSMFPPWGFCTECGVTLDPPGLDPDGVPRGPADTSWTICTRCGCDFCGRPARLVLEHAGRRAQVCVECLGEAIFALADDDGPGAPLVRIAACNPRGANQRRSRDRAPEAGHSTEDARAQAGQPGGSGAVAGRAEGRP